MDAHAFNPGTREANGFLGVRGQLVYTERPSKTKLNKATASTKKKKPKEKQALRST